MATQTLIQDKKFNTLVRMTIIETIQEVLRDPDFGLELQEWVQKRLSKRPQNLISFEDIKRKYR